MPAPRPAAFAIPGEISRKTGGVIYERSLLEALRAAGRDVAQLVLGDSFPDPCAADMARAAATLAAVPADRPVIIDGLVFGSIDTAALKAMRAPFVAMTHHPLALETGLAPARAAWLARREADNLALAAHVVVPSPHTAAILQAVRGQRQRTVVLISHQLSAAAACDRILVMEAGQLAQEGRHGDLVRERGPYRRLWEREQAERLQTA